MHSSFVIYTCITGGYDMLPQPVVIDSDADYICFVKQGDSHPEYEGIWKIEEVPYEIDDNQRLSRYPKLNPHLVLPDQYEYSLWVDANIRISDGSIYNICHNLIDSDVMYAGIIHPVVDCVYSEAKRCLFWRRDRWINLMRTVRLLRRNGIPDHCGMMENNVIFRKHSDPEIMAFDLDWWNFYSKYSCRDQLTHPLCRLLHPEIEYRLLLGRDDLSARNFHGLEYINHSATKVYGKPFEEKKIRVPFIRKSLKYYIIILGILFKNRTKTVPALH